MREPDGTQAKEEVLGCHLGARPNIRSSRAPFSNCSLPIEGPLGQDRTGGASPRGKLDG